MNIALAEYLIETLPFGMTTLFNPYRDHCVQDSSSNGPEAKLSRLSHHLNCNPEFILCGEAIGYAGGRYSGIAFTSERLLGIGAIPRVPAIMARLSTRKLPFSEPSATIVWRTLFELGIAERTLLWNAVQLHPCKQNMPWTNRTPTLDEIALGTPAMRILVDVFPQAKIVAVGKKAFGLLEEMGITPIAAVRHPANGGATLFTTGMKNLM